MPITASAAFGTTIDGQEIEIQGALSITLPGVTQTDYTLAIKSISFDTQDTTSYPADLTDQAGYSQTAGQVVLGGPVAPLDETITLVSLLNPDDPTSVLYRQQVKGAPLTFDFGVVPQGQAPELLRRVTGRVQSWVVDVAAGTVTIQFIDLTADWDQLPALPAVVTVDPFNAGLTSEYALDRIARAASGGTVSSWPAQRPSCVLACGFRTSLWPEVGTLDPTNPNQSGGFQAPIFQPGAYGSALFKQDPTTAPFPGLYYKIDPVTSTCYVEFIVNGATDANTKIQITLESTLDGSAGFFVRVQPTTLTVAALAPGGSHAFTGMPFGDGLPHHVAAQVALPSMGGTASTAQVYVDGVAQGAPVAINWASTRAADLDSVSVSINETGNPASGTIEALQVTTESAGTPTWPFVPQAILDPSLNPLQAVPPIDEGTAVWDEIQTIAEAEGGYAARDNTGRLIFLNRNAITQQTAFREIKVGTSLNGGITTQVGAVVEYDDIAIDYTEYSYGAKTSVFSPTVVWRIPARSTQSFTRTLANGALAAITDGPINLLPAGHSPTDGAHWFRASLDKNGVTEHGHNVTGTVTALTSSTFTVTFTNGGSADAYLVSSANYVDRAAGSIALWIGGIPVTPDQPTTVHVSYGDAKPTYTAPTNGYRQDRDATIAYGQFLLSALHRAKPTYQGVTIVPDARIVVPDKVTVDIPLVNGSVEKADVLVWGLTFSADFDQSAWSMDLDLRRVAPPGAWLLGVAGSSELGDGAGVTGTAWLY